MSREQGEILKRRMIEETLGLFGSGALIIEIPQQEVLDNTRLLREFSTKLLMAPKESTEAPDAKDVREDQGVIDITVKNSEDTEAPPSPRAATKRGNKRQPAKKSRKRKK